MRYKPTPVLDYKAYMVWQKCLNIILVAPYLINAISFSCAKGRKLLCALTLNKTCIMILLKIFTLIIYDNL